MIWQVRHLVTQELNAPDKIVITKPNETEVRSMIPCDSAGKFDPVVEDAMRKIVTSPHAVIR